jgi:hypothetical protein
MGVAYLIALIIYVLIALAIYKIFKKITDNKIILKLVIAFFVLLPTYDIIIGNALKFYYCKFTDMEKINKKIERPEVVFYQEEEPFSKYEYAFSSANSFLNYVQAIQLETKNGIHEFKAKQHTKPMDLKNVIEVPITNEARYIYKRYYENIPSFINKFIKISKYEIIDTQTNEIISWSKGIGVQKYNIELPNMSYAFKKGGCSGTIGYALLRKTIKGEEDAK